MGRNRRRSLRVLEEAAIFRLIGITPFTLSLYPAARHDFSSYSTIVNV